MGPAPEMGGSKKRKFRPHMPETSGIGIEFAANYRIGNKRGQDSNPRHGRKI